MGVLFATVFETRQIGEMLAGGGVNSSFDFVLRFAEMVSNSPADANIDVLNFFFCFLLLGVRAGDFGDSSCFFFAAYFAELSIYRDYGSFRQNLRKIHDSLSLVFKNISHYNSPIS